MKILRFDDDRVGVLKGDDQVVDVSVIISYRVEKGPQRVMEELIEGFDIFREKIEAIVACESGIPLSSVKLLAPLPRPGKCIAAFVNYLPDMTDVEVENIPSEFFFKNNEFIGPQGTIELLDIPPVTVTHPEPELALVIGKSGRNITEDDAMNYVFGYVPFLDISARGLTRRSQFLPKAQHTYSVCGPWIVTKDEIPDPHALQVTLAVNGEIRQNFNTGEMIHNIPDQICWLTRFVWLRPGDVISTGTQQPHCAINGGDVLDIDIEKIGKARFFVKQDGPRKDPEIKTPPRMRLLDITKV